MGIGDGTRTRNTSRPALIVKVCAPTPFYMVSTHLSYQGEMENDDAVRVEQLKYLTGFLAEKQLSPIILAGDLNSAPEDDSINFLRKSFDVFSDNSGLGPTCTTKFGWQQIDFITGFPQGKFTCKQIFRGNDRTASDHYAVITDLEF